MKDTTINQPNATTLARIAQAREDIRRIQLGLADLERKAKNDEANWGTAGTAAKAAEDLRDLANFL